MNDTKTLDELLEEYRLIDMRIQVCIAQRDAVDKEVQANIDKEGAEAQWRCQRAAKMTYALQKTKMKLDEQRYEKLLEICELMRGKEEKKGLNKFVSDAKQQIYFIGSKVFKKKLSFEAISRGLDKAEKAISDGNDIDFGNLTFAKIRNYMKFNRQYSVELYKEYRKIYKQSCAKMVIDGFKEKYGREVSDAKEIAIAMDELVPELEDKFTANLAKEVEVKKAQMEADKPLKSPVISAKPMKKEELSVEQQQKFEEIHAKIELKSANQPRLESAEDKQIRIQEDISHIKSEINDVYENPVSAFGFTEEETQKLDAKRSEAALLQGQLDDMAAEEKRMFEERRKAKIEADKAARAERIAAINRKNAVEEARRVMSHLKTSTGYYNVANLSDDEVLDTYKQIAESPSMADRLSEARLEAQAEKQNVELQPDLSINAEEKGQETVTPESVFGTPVGLEPIPMEVTEKDMEPEVTPVPIISESEELRNGIDNETIEEIAANLTPDMYEHYRSVMNSFEPDSDEYRNASAVVDMYDRQSAINTLHQGNSR
ncbi:MAG: hypothetical protein HFH45_03700 [Bacilli bacterium]|nr:hypothetical protein [Bacilli bacterium]